MTEDVFRRMTCPTLRKGATFASRFLPRMPNEHLHPAKSGIVGRCL